MRKVFRLSKLIEVFFKLNRKEEVESVFSSSDLGIKDFLIGVHRGRKRTEAEYSVLIEFCLASTKEHFSGD